MAPVAVSAGTRIAIAARSRRRTAGVYAMSWLSPAELALVAAKEQA
jgi:hypothetical protein